MATGWGNKTWGASEWGDLSNETVSVSGISATTSIGSSTTQANADVDVTGSQLTFTNAGAVAGASADVSVTGIQANLSIGEEDIARGIQQNVTGSQLTTTPGAVTIDEQFLIGAGWGRDTYGNLGWGVNYSVIPAEGVGIQLTSSLGDESAFTDVTINVTGSELTTTFASPTISIQIDQDIFVLAAADQLDGFVGSSTFQADANVNVTGTQATLSQGTAEAGLLLEVPVTGIQLTSTIGTIALEQSTNEPATGQELTLSLGTAEEIPQQIVGVSGIELTGSVGSVTVTGIANVQVTGISASLSLDFVDVTAWQEIDPGVNNVWTEVDLAA
jgi:hypothetical protein